MDESIKSEFSALAEQIRKGFDANDRQFRALKTRIAKLELELNGVKKMENRRAEEIIELKTRKAS